jgi:uncharacterized OB-fold protein
MKVTERVPFTIEQFYKHVSQGKLLGGRCTKCGKVHLPPRPMCDNCYSKDFEWIDVPKGGKLVSYTVIHIAPAQFQPLAPYVMGIVQLTNGSKIPGMVRGVATDQIKIGMELMMDFEACVATQPWPQWPRYYFRPLASS